MRNLQSFPSQNTVDRISKLKKVDFTPTDIHDLSAQEIADKVRNEHGGEATVNVSKAPKDGHEIENLRQASDMDGVTIHIIGEPNGENGLSEEDEILREIVQEGMDENGKGIIAFRSFLAKLFSDENKELTVDEWNKYVVKRGVTVEESHHLNNAGIKRESQGPDSLREKYREFIRTEMEAHREWINTLFESGVMGQHPIEEMNSEENRLELIGLADGSNFNRGGAYYLHKRGMDAVNSYPPRQLAVEAINEANQLETS